MTLDRLVSAVVEAGDHPSWGDMVTILATTALRISEASGLHVGDVDLQRGLLHVFRQTYPRRGGLITKETKGRRRRTGPVIDPLRPTLVRLTAAPCRAAPDRTSRRSDHHRDPARRDQPGPAGLRDRPARAGPSRPAAHRAHVDGRRRDRAPHPPACGRAPGPGRHIPLPAPRCAGDVGGRSPILGLVVPDWSPASDARGRAQRPDRGMKNGPDLRWCGQTRCVGLTGFEPATP
jgi:hypothetical protein